MICKPSLVAPAEYVTQYGTDLVVSRSSSKDRYILGADCSYEDQQTTLSTSSDGGLVIFEHIELKSGGSHFYDPSKPYRDLVVGKDE